MVLPGRYTIREGCNYTVSNRSLAIVLLVVASLMWSLGGVLIKLVNWNPVAIAGIRSAIAAVVIFPFLERPRFSWSRTELGGAVGYAATVVLCVTATKATTAANAIVLQYSSPIYVALFSHWFLSERVSHLDWAATLLVIGGMALFFLDKLSATGLWGNLAAIGSGISMAVMVMFLRKQKDGSPLSSIFLGNLMAALVALPFALRSLPSDPKSWLGLGLLGTVQLGIPFVLYAFSIKHVSALEAILVSVLEPILNPIWVLLWLGEMPGKWSLAGGIVVLVTVTLRMLAANTGFKRLSQVRSGERDGAAQM